MLKRYNLVLLSQRNWSPFVPIVATSEVANEFIMARSPFLYYDWAPSHGLVNSSHTTNLTMVYKKGSLLTPWPWVVGSILLSVLLGSLSVWTSWSKWRHQPHIKHPHRLGVVVEKPRLQPREIALATLAALGVLIPTIRAIVALIISIRVHIIKTGSYGAPSALLVLMTSLHIALTNLSLQPAMRYIVHTGFALAWVASIINFTGGAGSNFYSSAIIVGGNCAGRISDCLNWVQDTSLSPPTFYGCSSGDTPVEDADQPTNAIRVVEICFGGVATIYGLGVCLAHPQILRLLLAPLDIFHLIREHGVVGAFSRRTWRPWFRVPEDGDLDGIARGTYLRKVYSHIPAQRSIIISQGWALAIAVVVCCIAIPMHVVTEVHPRSAGIYQDSSPASLGTGAENGAWTDCFDLRPPSDAWGFWKFWWNRKTAWVLHAVGVV